MEGDPGAAEQGRGAGRAVAGHRGVDAERPDRRHRLEAVRGPGRGRGEEHRVQVLPARARRRGESDQGPRGCRPVMRLCTSMARSNQ